MPPIVIINASETVAPAPITYQQTGAFISQGGTTLSTNTMGLITQVSDLTAILAPPLALSSLVWSGGTVVATAAAAITGRQTGDVFATTIAGASPPGYNGTFRVTMTGPNTFTYALATNPGVETTSGNFTPPNQVELLAMIGTFYTEGSSVAVNVLELGPGDAATGPAELQTWDQTNPGINYAYCVPRGWDGQTAYIALCNAYTAPNAKKYFFTTTSPANYLLYKGIKSVMWVIEAPGVPFTEYSIASAFQHALAYNPSTTNRMTPFAFSYLFGVTAYPTTGGNSTLLAQIKAANGNYVGTGAEGGISNKILMWGTTADGMDFAWWYAADWLQLNADRNTANAVINGSNNPLAPLYYNQPGIDTLQDVVVATVRSGITFGLLTGSVTRATLDGPVLSSELQDGTFAGQNVVNAVPFNIYTQENPADYGTGTYAGLAVVCIPQNGFKQIIININITNLLSL